MGAALLWWLWAGLLGLAALPLTFTLFRHLPDRGYPLSKALGLLIVAYLLWLAGSFRLLPNELWAIWLILLLVAAVSLAVLSRQRQAMREFLSRHLAYIALTEAVFLAFFLAMALLRAYSPPLGTTEQPMDLALLNASLRAESFPPQDPWLSGHGVNYYYFGYLMAALLTRLSGLPGAVGYNLALASLYGLAALGAFSLGYNLVRATLGSARAGVATGLAAAGFLLALGNWEGVLELARARGWGAPGLWEWVGIPGLAAAAPAPSWIPTEFWWWWRATRMLDQGGAITEFPIFSFILGDLHPHVMALPFGLLALGLALNLFLAPSLGLRPLFRHVWLWGGTALGLGALGFLNSWDLPTYGFILAGAVLLQGRLEGRGVIRSLALIALCLSLALALYWPFYAGFAAQARGALPVLGLGSRPFLYLLFWGPFLFFGLSLAAALALPALRGQPVSVRQAYAATLPLLFLLALWLLLELAASLLAGGLAAGLGEAAGRAWLLLPLGGILSLLLLALMRGRESRRVGRGPAFALGLLFTGLFLTYGVELFYIWDIFGYRVNTVFKLYYQAWALLAVAAAYGLYYLLARWRSAVWAKALWVGLGAALVAGAFYYTVGAASSRMEGFARPPDLDGLAGRAGEADAAGVAWLQANVAGVPVVLEAWGDSWSDYGRISSRTGLPTVLGWRFHEVQWRGHSSELAERAQDIDAIYRDGTPAQAVELLKKYGVSYVYVGPLEREKYGPGVAGRLASLLETAYSQGLVTIFRVRE